MKKNLFLLLLAATSVGAQTVLTTSPDAKHTDGRLDAVRLTTAPKTPQPFYGQTIDQQENVIYTNGFDVKVGAVTYIPTPPITMPLERNEWRARLDTIDPTKLFIQSTTGKLYYYKTGNGWETIDLSLPKYDCEPYETFSGWQAKSEGNDVLVIHKHEWVYAEREDVNNERLNITTAAICLCGCGVTENQARVCSACFRHEWRTREYGQRPKEKVKSKYLQILEGVKE